MMSICLAVESRRAPNLKLLRQLSRLPDPVVFSLPATLSQQLTQPNRRTITYCRLPQPFREAPREPTSTACTPILSRLCTVETRHGHHGLLKHLVRGPAERSAIRADPSPATHCKNVLIAWLTRSCSRLVNLAIGAVMVMGGKLALRWLRSSTRNALTTRRNHWWNTC